MKKNSDDIIKILKDYLENTSSEVLDQDFAEINALDSNGISFEDYVHALNGIDILSSSIICDDITYSNLYKSLIQDIVMGPNDDDKDSYFTETNSYGSNEAEFNIISYPQAA